MHANLRSFKGIFPQIGKNVYLDPSSILIGDIFLGDDVSIWPFVAARGDINKIIVGQRTNIQDASVLHVTHKSEENPHGHSLIIGDDVTVGHRAMLHGCTVGNKVLIGMGSIILDGAIIEDEVMIGAGSLVPPRKRLESGHLYIGTPVKAVRILTKLERSYLLESASNYVATKNVYIAESIIAESIITQST